MASNILSRFLPSADEDYRPQPSRRAVHHSDLEDQAGMNIDEENLDARFQDQDLETLLAEAAEGGDIDVEDSAFLRQQRRNQKKVKSGEEAISMEEPLLDEDNEVPASLLLDAKRPRKSKKDRPAKRLPPRPSELDLPPPVPGPSSQQPALQWQKTAQAPGTTLPASTTPRWLPRRSGQVPGAQLIVDPKEKALWRWANVENLDGFLVQVYEYYAEHGIWSILLARVLRLLSILFIVWFVTFLTFCIEYKALPKSTKLEQVRVPQCASKLPFLWNFSIWAGSAFWIYSLISNLLDIQRLWEMHDFYKHLLGIPDRDIQTVTWQYVVGRLMALRDANVSTAQNTTAEHRKFFNGQSKQRMDAHDIANRLMRRDNYWIAIVNREILDCTLNIPFFGKRQFFTRVIEWNVGLALMDFVFDEHFQLKPQFQKSQYRRQLIEKLKNRFIIVGILNIFTAFPAAIFYIVREFFTTFTEYQKNPSELGARSFSPLAQWKFRDFNEVHHMFDRRSKVALPYAARYLDQFPKDKTAQLFKFVALISGAIAAVLGLWSLLDPELFLGFEILGRTVLFWLGILTPIYLSARAATPEDEMILDPEFALLNVIECTHYYPASWQGRLHTDEVRGEFSQLFKLKIMLYLEELASVILAPLILLFSLPNCAEQLIDFFREFTVHVEGLGHVCSFAVFDFTRVGEAAPRTAGPNPAARAARTAGTGAPATGTGAATDLREDYYTTRDNKIRASMHNFMDQYADNPKRGLGRTNSAAARRNHLPYLPPIFPGLAASGILGHVPEFYAAGMMGTGQYGTTGAGVGRQGREMRQSYLQTPRAGPSDTLRDRSQPGGFGGSPMHSILLDPHHQPRTTSSPYQRPQRAGTHPIDGIAEDEGEQKSNSRMMEEDDDLGKSWAIRAEGDPNEAFEDDDQNDGKTGGAGVLGLLYQFQKQQTEGRGTHL